MVFGQVNGKKTDIDSHAASEVSSSSKLIENTTLPLDFAGIENQYFAVLVEPEARPTKEDRWDSKTIALLLKKVKDAPQKSDVGIRITSRPIVVGPNVSVEHTYRVFAGPKTEKALEPYRASGLASYRKNWIPLAPELARYVITPTLAFTYDLTVRFSRLAGGKVGNYGIAIILLTLLVRGIMFPLGRKAGEVGAEDADAPAPAQGNPGKIQGRQRKADPRAVRAIQETRSESDRRLFAGPDPTANFCRALASAQHEFPP